MLRPIEGQRRALARLHILAQFRAVRIVAAAELPAVAAATWLETPRHGEGTATTEHLSADSEFGFQNRVASQAGDVFQPAQSSQGPGVCVQSSNGRADHWA